jgi:hypothetical protein
MKTTPTYGVGVLKPPSIGTVWVLTASDWRVRFRGVGPEGWFYVDSLNRPDRYPYNAHDLGFSPEDFYRIFEEDEK